MQICICLWMLFQLSMWSLSTYYNHFSVRNTIVFFIFNINVQFSSSFQDVCNTAAEVQGRGASQYGLLSSRCQTMPGATSPLGFLHSSWFPSPSWWDAVSHHNLPGISEDTRICKEHEDSRVRIPCETMGALLSWELMVTLVGQVLMRWRVSEKTGRTFMSLW